MRGRVCKRSGPGPLKTASTRDCAPLNQKQTVEDLLTTTSPAQASPAVPAPRRWRRTEEAPAPAPTPTPTPAQAQADVETDIETGADTKQAEPQSKPRLRPRRGKRCTDVDVDDNIDKPDSNATKRARLTRKNLARLEKMHRPSKKSKSSSRPTATGTEATPASGASGASGATRTTTTTTTTTASGFGVLAMTNGILDPDMSKPPANLDAIRARQGRRRDSVSPPASAYRGYVNKVKGASNETTMVVHLSTRLLQQDDSLAYQASYNQACTAFPKNAGFNNDMSTPQPDFVEGLAMREFLPCPVHLDVPGAVLYKDDAKSVTLPHIAGEWKASNKDMDRAAVQSAYDGAALVYARNQALDYLGTPDPPGHAEITTFTTNGSTINFYAHYATTDARSGKTKYHQYHVGSFQLVNSYEEYETGRRWLRNAQDYAKEQSYAMRDRLVTHHESHEALKKAALATAAAGQAPRGAADAGVDESEDAGDGAPGRAGSTGGRKRKASVTSSSSLSEVASKAEGE